MDIIKRSGASEPYDGAKIVAAIEGAFSDTGRTPEPSQLDRLLACVEGAIEADGVRTVEGIQDIVERCLMEQGCFEEAKAYILYRHKRAELRAARADIVFAVAGCRIERGASCCADAQGDDSPAALAARLDAWLARIQDRFSGDAYALSTLSAKFKSFVKPSMTVDERLAALTRAAVELTAQEAPQWEFIAARLLLFSFRRTLAADCAARGIETFYDKVRWLTDQDLYGAYVLQRYTRAELEQAASFMVPERDELFTYSGLDLLIKRYVITTRRHVAIESPQEMFLGIALHLAMEEPVDRMGWVRRFYDMLSKLEVTMATPTMSNARKPHHQLSSCFIDTVPDSLEGIYRSIDNFAQVSKFGGGMGMYLGKVRATGGTIRGFEGAAGGVIRWIRIINDTAVAVDQLGMRAGAAAVYLDAWHKDLPEFLQLRTNNGDDRMKAHDVFPAVCYPDLFWRMAGEDMNQEWHLMCPHDILTVKGYALEDYFGEEWEKRYLDCVADPRISKRVMTIKDIVRLVLKSAVETGTPFTFNRDIVNRANPNPQAGIVYCSNLCTEIAQNMAPVESVSVQTRTSEGDTVVVSTTRPGDFVVCNLASLSLGRLPVEDEDAMRDVVRTAVRALDNVIDLNFYALEYARITNKRYRSIGLGVSGYHHMLAVRGIRWESEEHLRFADEVFERINRCAVEASADLAREKGSYDVFEGSDWQTGAYFDKRGYASAAWENVRAKAARGMRNAYLMAVAPTSSTSILAGTTPGIDPIMRRFFLEEKKGGMLPRVAPDLSPATYWLYKPAHLIDQSWSVRASGVRQRHVDQAQSMNLYITNDFTMRQVFDLYHEAWKAGVKTVYYVRSKSLEVQECESCAS
ncbi:MAG: ribonucleoside-diphosphate reductase subunit alpha [Slackia sp.]|nr:ribonucleoside-diphosphate reductase subunit alpha [Slackia sp.]